MTFYQILATYMYVSIYKQIQRLEPPILSPRQGGIRGTTYLGPKFYQHKENVKN